MAQHAEPQDGFTPSLHHAAQPDEDHDGQEHADTQRASFTNVRLCRRDGSRNVFGQRGVSRAQGGQHCGRNERETRGNFLYIAFEHAVLSLRFKRLDYQK